MLQTQITILELWHRAGEALRDAAASRLRDDRGEVTAQTALIFLLVVAAIAAGGVIAARITGAANRVPQP